MSGPGRRHAALGTPGLAGLMREIEENLRLVQHGGVAPSYSSPLPVPGGRRQGAPPVRGWSEGAARSVGSEASACSPPQPRRLSSSKAGFRVHTTPDSITGAPAAGSPAVPRLLSPQEPVTPASGQPLWLSNELADDSPSRSCATPPHAPASPHSPLSAAYKGALSDAFLTPLSAGSNQLRTPDLAAQKENRSTAKSPGRASSAASPQRRSALAVLQQRERSPLQSASPPPAARGLECPAPSRRGAADLAGFFAAAEAELQGLHEAAGRFACMDADELLRWRQAEQARSGEPAATVRDAGTQAGAGPAEEQTAALEAALQETSACLRDSLSREQELQLENEQLRRQLGGLQAAQPVSVEPATPAWLSAAPDSLGEQAAAGEAAAAAPAVLAAEAAWQSSSGAAEALPAAEASGSVASSMGAAEPEPGLAAPDASGDGEEPAAGQEQAESSLDSPVLGVQHAPGTPRTPQPADAGEASEGLRPSERSPVAGSGPAREARQGRSSWDLPSPAGMSGKAASALREAVLAIRQNEALLQSTARSRPALR